MDILFFFFQAEDGIRDADVTGVQTCALPIWQISPHLFKFKGHADFWPNFTLILADNGHALAVDCGVPETFLTSRSEEHTSELQSRPHLVCRLLLEKKK